VQKLLYCCQLAGSKLFFSSFKGQSALMQQRKTLRGGKGGRQVVGNHQCRLACLLKALYQGNYIVDTNGVQPGSGLIKKMYSGSAARARAMATRFFIPPDNSAG